MHVSRLPKYKFLNLFNISFLNLRIIQNCLKFLKENYVILFSMIGP